MKWSASRHRKPGRRAWNKSVMSFQWTSTATAMQSTSRTKEACAEPKMHGFGSFSSCKQLDAVSVFDTCILRALERKIWFPLCSKITTIWRVVSEEYDQSCAKRILPLISGWLGLCGRAPMHRPNWPRRLVQALCYSTWDGMAESLDGLINGSTLATLILVIVLM